MTAAQIELPPKLIEVFVGEADIRGAHGGRGSGKTRSFAKMAAVRGYQFGMAGISGIILCARQFMNSLEDSSLEEVKRAIEDEPFLRDYYIVGEKYVKSKDGRITFAFAGLDRNIASVKSKGRILLCWVDEAEPVTDFAWTILIPTLREEGEGWSAELWVTWNPKNEDAPVEKRFRDTDNPRIKVIELNWRDNPKFPAKLERDRLADLAHRPEEYDHIWEGGYRIISDALIFKNRVSFAKFDPPPEGTRLLFGADWGFANDPTALIRCWIKDECLYIDYEAFGYGVEIDETPQLFDSVPEARKWPIKADGARPETISYMARQGFNIRAADKWPGSVEDGIAHMKGFKRIFVHDRCPHIAKEFRNYSYKVDKHTEDILPIIVDKFNHGIDAVRYSLDGYIQRRGALGQWAKLAG